MDLAIIVAIDFVYAIATLALISLGLAIVFGMMRIINLAHGEFMVMGSYSASVAVHHGINIWVAILIVPPIAVGIIGAIIERLIVRQLYGRMVETMLATWGLSLFIVGILTMIFGDITEGVPTPLPGITIGAYQTSGYSLFVIALSVATMGGVYIILRFEPAGAAGARHHAERRYGGRARHRHLAHLRGDIRLRRRACRFRRRRAGAGVRRVSDHRRLLYRPRLHHRHRRRRGDRSSAPLRPRSCSASSTRSPRS